MTSAYEARRSGVVGMAIMGGGRSMWLVSSVDVVGAERGEAEREEEGSEAVASGAPSRGGEGEWRPAGLGLEVRGVPCSGGESVEAE